MNPDYDSYQSPLSSRYAARAMRELFGPRKKFGTWRRLWLALAEAERELGLAQITEAALAEMRDHLDDINFEVAERREKDVRHDVMAHVYAFGQQAPAAAGIIHLGATSCYVTDNADLLIFHEAMGLVKQKLLGVIRNLADFARHHADVPCLGSTHFQVAQLTTVGKRATLWLSDLMMDYAELAYLTEHFPIRGVKGTTGTQASFVALFHGDKDKVKQLDQLVCQKMGASGSLPVTGQTYSRKIDYAILSALAGIGISLQKFATDMRLLMGIGELEEPVEKGQIGSSAMAYKRNPMRSERICSLARHLLALADSAGHMAGQQWLERTLDDSAARRIIIPEAFLISDVILSLASNVTSGIVVNRAVIDQRIRREMPFMATEEIIMEYTRRGGDRQHAHEIIRTYSHAVVKNMRESGGENDLLERLLTTQEFADMREFIRELSHPLKLCGRAEDQVHEYLLEYVMPLIAAEGTGSQGETLEV